MNCTRRNFLSLAGAGALATLAACGNQGASPSTTASTPADTGEKVDLKEFEKLAIDMGAWNYDKDNDVWWQTGITYCLKPASETYEQLAIYVPGPYMTGEEKGKLYSCTIDKDAKVGDYTAATAPVVMPLNPGNYAGQAASTAYSYQGMAPYLDAGLVYVYAGFRGRNNGYDSITNEFYSGGAPWPVVDIKAAIRCLRYNDKVLPGDSDHVVTFGQGGSGELSAIVGSSGDAPAYEKYLEQLGAATHDAEGKDLSDATFGSVSWCPTTSFSMGDAAYEWLLGQYDETGTRDPQVWTSRLSHDLAVAYATQLNSLGLTNDEGVALALDETSGDDYVAGTYYSHVLAAVEFGASEFFKTVQFPYTPDTSTQTNGNFPGDGNLKAAEEEAVANATTAPDAAPAPAAGAAPAATPSFASVDEYVAALNSGYAWLTYNESRHEVTIANLGSYVRHCCPPSRGVCAFDAFELDQPGNQLFGTDDADSAHFDGTVLALLSQNTDAYAKLKGWDEKYLKAWTADLAITDAFKVKTADRVLMFDPMFFLSGYYKDGFGTAKVAQHWRINTGLAQSASTLTNEVNLVAALKAYDGVKSVEFNPVWGRGRALVERSGKADENFVAWVRKTCKPEKKSE